MSSSPSARSRLTRANDLAVELAIWEMENKRRRIVSCREWAAGGWDAWRIVRNLHAAQCIFAWGTLCRRGPRRFEVPSLHMARLRCAPRHRRSAAPVLASAQMQGLARIGYACVLSCPVNLLLHECCKLLFAVHVQLGVDIAGVGSDGVDRHHLAVGDLLGGSAAGQA